MRECADPRGLQGDGLDAKLANVARNRRPALPLSPCRRQTGVGGGLDMLGTILIVILILALVGALPTWGHSRSWGYFPSGGLGLVLVIVIVLLLLGRL